MNIRTIASTDDFDTGLKEAGSKLVVVEFYADWCEPCRMIAPKLTELANEYPDIVVFKVNINKNADLCEKCHLQGIPFFIFFKEQKKLEEFPGANEVELTAAIQKYRH